ncbi:hypothetical protein EJB05_38913 [Eragrostis curvula]|uniref:DUF1618 domain-containing protein n=1 Tax=Eragrostis curvula TaxID=38414 RepID=A0A5J9TVL8_9POAL|nr:hypothetical protein EJB05_38913 [Eragrostis curvula]
MKTDPQVSEPPVISHLSMVRQVGAGVGARLLAGGTISGTDKSLVVLYAGKVSLCSSSGCYLVYDASDNSLAAIPQLPDRHTFRGLGGWPAILSLSEGSYVVAELVEAKSRFPNAELFLWRSLGTPNQEGQWIRRAVRLPPQEFSRGHRFRIDMAFTFTEFRVCWVDLFKGVLVCNLMESPEPTFTFVPSPIGCSIELERRVIPGPQQFRTMGCVRGTIKFVALDGFNERHSPQENIMIRTWTLSPDLKEWAEGTPLRVGDLWASESFLQSGLPRLGLTYPVISFDEPDVVYFVLNEIDRVDAFNRFGDVSGVRLVCKALYVLGLDTVQQKVLCHTKVIPDNLSPIFPGLLASEFSAHLQRSKDHQGELEASEPGGNQKEMKHASEEGGSEKQMKHASGEGGSEKQMKHANEEGGSRKRMKR